MNTCITFFTSISIFIFISIYKHQRHITFYTRLNTKMVKKYQLTWYLHITTKKTNSPTPGCSRQATIIKTHIVKMIYLKNCQSFVYKGFTLIGCAFLSPVKLYNAPETGSWYTHFPFAVSVLFLSHTTLVSHSKMYWHPATYSKTGTPCNET